MAENMGFGFGLNGPNTIYKRKHRWLLKIPDVSAEGIDTLPPQKSARPSLSFKEIEAQHLTETVYFPGKPDWKPIPLTLYELKKPNRHPVWDWLTDPKYGWTYAPNRESAFQPSCDGFKKQKARLEMYDGCGETIETWIFESVWFNDIQFGELDMTDSGIVMCELTLRYDRAYWQQGCIQT